MSDIADPYVEPFIEHGEINLRTEPEKLISRSREPDTMPLTYQDQSAAAYAIGSTIAGYTTMPIVDRERTRSGPNYLYRLGLEGIADPTKEFIETDYEEVSAEEGWDEIRRTVFTRKPGKEWFAKGAQLVSELTGLVLPGYENLWIMDRNQRRHRAAGYFDVSMVLKGMIGEKPYKRRYNGSPQTTTNTVAGPFAASFDTWVGYPPVAGSGASISGTDQTIEWDIPQTSITDVFLTTTPPPTAIYPGFWTPNDPPPVFIFPVYAIEYTYHVPFGWKIMNMQAEQLAGQQMFLLSLTFGYQKAVTPKG